MHRIGFVFSIGLFLATCGIFAFSLHEASAICGSSNSAIWRTLPTNEIADSNRQFDTAVLPGNVSLQLNWAFLDTPFIGNAEVAESGNVNIDTGTVSYNPSYFFPSTCIGSVGIHVEGQLVPNTTTGTLKSLGWVWDSGSPPPYDEDIHTLSISS